MSDPAERFSRRRSLERRQAVERERSAEEWRAGAVWFVGLCFSFVGGVSLLVGAYLLFGGEAARGAMALRILQGALLTTTGVALWREREWGRRLAIGLLALYFAASLVRWVRDGFPVPGGLTGQDLPFGLLIDLQLLVGLVYLFHPATRARFAGTADA
ncbi:MAG: hypothetical protein ACF8XB_22100 [Planctomycetota bacterium JB042]